MSAREVFNVFDVLATSYDDQGRGVPLAVYRAQDGYMIEGLMKQLAAAATLQLPAGSKVTIEVCQVAHPLADILGREQKQ